jgi:hypothetical protein
VVAHQVASGFVIPIKSLNRSVDDEQPRHRRIEPARDELSMSACTTAAFSVAMRAQMFEKGFRRARVE